MENVGHGKQPRVPVSSGPTDSSSAIITEIASHVEFVWRSVRRLGVPEQLADDVTQQVFEAAIRNAHRIDPGCARSFLFRTAMNEAAHVRRSAARRKDEPTEQLPEQTDSTPPIEVLVDMKTARTLLDRVMDQMPDELRAVFVLHELEEATMAEISALTNLPPGTVASRLRRAREEYLKLVDSLRHPPTPQGGAL